MTIDHSIIARREEGPADASRPVVSPHSPAELSGAFVLMPPIALCMAMILLAAALAKAAALDIRQLIFPYLASACAITLLGTLGFIFLEVSKLARVGADDPIGKVKKQVLDRAPLLVLPAIVLPLFLIGYTAAKCAIPFLVGYSWDAFFADADRYVFGDDVWHLTRHLLGSSNSRFWEWLYTVGWGGAFFIVANAISLFGTKRLAGVYFTAMLATWLIGGCLMAYAFSAAGPVFAQQFDPGLYGRFNPLRETLAGSLGDGPIRFTQQYLANMAHVHVAIKGGGISAMPSMHVAAASIYVLAARGTKLMSPAVLFWMIIFVASGYFGYHYWVDGIAAAAVAFLCWTLVEYFYRLASSDRRSSLSSAEVRTSITPI